MRHLFRSFALAALTLAPLARAQPNRRPIKQAVEALDDVWRRRGLKSRMELFRHALDQYLSGLGEAAAAARVRGA